MKNRSLPGPGDHMVYPRLFLSTDDLAALKGGLEVESSEIERWSSRQPIDKYNIESPMRAWFASGDAALGAAIVKRSQDWLKLAVEDDLLDQYSRVTLGVAPHNQSVQLLPTINLTDAALSCDCLSTDQRKRMLAQIAFLAYALDREDYWSPERGVRSQPQHDHHRRTVSNGAGRVYSRSSDGQ
jgi:hypothetical protein